MRFVAPLIAALALLCSGVDGCDVCEGDDCGAEGEGEGEAAEDCADFGCVNATPGCDAGAIRQERGADGVTEVCATCAFEGVDGEICGAPEVATCESREAATGELCRVCATDFGEILYQDCYESSAELAERCEPYVDEQTGQVCSVCLADDGRVVERRCEPQFDDCVEIDVDGASCLECTIDGQVAALVCDQPRIAPRTCERYENENGRCVDCYDDATLLSHICTPPGDEIVACVEETTIEGLVCQRCSDASGAVRYEFCGTAPTALKCEQLSYTDQTCVVCVDENGVLASSQCECVTDGCEPTPCAFEDSGDGQICRTCGEERECVSSTSSLTCGTEPAFADVNGGSDTCTVCHDAPTGVEVYRDCNNNGPAICSAEANADGSACEVCTDPEDGSVQYTTCGERVCYDVGSRQLTGRNGGVLQLDGQPAVAKCGACRADGDLEFETSCQLRNDCASGDIVDPTLVCPDSVVFKLIPALCANPWELAGYEGPAGSVDEVLKIMAYALETGSLGVVSVDRRGDLGNSACFNECSCARGDVIELEVRGNQDAARAQDLFGAVIAHCSQSGCNEGGVCRQDGACSY